MRYSRVKKANTMKQKYSIRKVSAIGAASALIGSTFFLSPLVNADEVVPTMDLKAVESTETTQSNTDLNNTSVSGEVSTLKDSKQDETVESSVDVTKTSSTLLDTQTETDAVTGLSTTAQTIAKEAGLDVTNLTDNQKSALNKIQLTDDTESGLKLTYKDFEAIADTLVEQDSRYAIPYFNASSIKNMAAATTKDAQTGQVADLDVWDSWPVQDIRTGQVVNWNGYQLVVAMMGIPNTNDNHIYLLYNTYGDNNFDNWKNAGSIFGYGLTATTQQWSGSAVVNTDGTIQLFYTNVDTTDNNSNNQMLATATLNLAVENNAVVIKSVENNNVLTPKGGDGYFYQSYQQWRTTFTGSDNIAMRDPHVIEDSDGSRYLVFEASTGTQRYQGENQIYNFTNYGGNSAYNVKSLLRILENSDMYERAKWSNAAIGILKLSNDEKNPTILKYYTPLLSSVMVSDELERPNLVKLGDKYYLFTASRLNHGSNNDAWNKANTVVGDNVVMLGYVSDVITGGYKPLNGSGVVLTASVPADWRTATYSYYAVPVEGSTDKLLITAYMTNRNEVAGVGKNSTWAPSFLIQINPNGTTRVLAEMTEQGDWIWDESSRTQSTVGTIDSAHLPGEDDGYIDWYGIGGYGLKPHTPVTPTEDPNKPNNPELPKETPLRPVTPTNGGGKTLSRLERSLPNTGESNSKTTAVLGLFSLVAFVTFISLGKKTIKSKK
ncbi:MAG: glycoside hydrolase family 68 protein [Streptococcus sp.]|nr:glycoside hydrolase family 68 protein [Streptococcus sp.]